MGVEMRYEGCKGWAWIDQAANKPKYQFFIYEKEDDARSGVPSDLGVGAVVFRNNEWIIDEGEKANV
jgi:hypothetical protein